MEIAILKKSSNSNGSSSYEKEMQRVAVNQAPTPNPFCLEGPNKIQNVNSDTDLLKKGSIA